MNVDFEVVKNTVFGKFLGSAFQETLRQLLAEKGDPSTLNTGSLDIDVTLNGKSLDLQRVFSSFEKEISTQAVATPPARLTAEVRSQDEIVVTRAWLEELSAQLESICDETHSVDSSVYDCFHEAACAAANVVGEVAQEQAREAAGEHSMGDEANYEVRDRVGEAQSSVNGVLSALNSRQQATG